MERPRRTDRAATDAHRVSVRRLAALRLLVCLALLGSGMALVAPAQDSSAQVAEPREAGAEEAPSAEEGTAEAPAAVREVFVAPVRSIIQPVAAEFLLESLAAADAANAEALIIELDTPGGLLTSTREIFSAMLAADTPVVVWVAPPGAQAASAGFFLLMAADVAAMAPGANTGAAHPVGGQGEDIEGTMGEKVEQDAAATIRSLAARNQRDQVLAERAVVESLSWSVDEAIEAGLADLQAPTLQRLLEQLDGRRVEKREGEERTLRTEGAMVRRLEMTPFQRIRTALAHPNIAVLLMSLGGLGLMIEIYNPGAIFPGVVGAIALIMGLYSLSVLPVNYAGVALFGLAALLFLAEIKVQSFGLLSVGGVVSLVLGALMMFDSPDPALRVGLDVIVAMAALSLLAVALLAGLAVRARRSRVSTGEEGLIGRIGEVRTAIVCSSDRCRGKVAVHGELWTASADQPIGIGERVRVAGVEGLMLRVAPVTRSGAEAGMEGGTEGGAEGGTASGEGAG
ncbi:MAG TPA: nodulation protein NfeD [Thermoanaerobaculia bacterium]|nr:nodulation protein NfeD [Thermoanaerobaculia bacterium]